MRRILNPVVAYLEDSRRALAESWDAFWFRPADPTLLGLIRIMAGLMLVYTHAVWGLVLDDFFGPKAWLSPKFVRFLQADRYTYSFWWVVPNGWQWVAFGLSMVALVMFTVGLWTRLTSVLALIVTISFAHRAPLAMFGLDQINAVLALYLAIGPSGQALSVDRWLARRRGIPAPAPSASANLAIRLINVHMCLIYFCAGTSKLQGEAWWDGGAMWLALSNLEYQSTDMTWLVWHPWLLNLATHVCVLWEISFAALIWQPKLRPLVLTISVFLHVGIGAFLGMWTFGLIMLVGCASFLPTEEVGRFFANLSSRNSEPPTEQSEKPGREAARLGVARRAKRFETQGETVSNFKAGR